MNNQLNAVINFVKTNQFDIILTSSPLNITALLTQQASGLQYVSIQNHIMYKSFIIDLKKDRDLLYNSKNPAPF